MSVQELITSVDCVRLFMDSRMIYNNNNKYADKWPPFIRDLLIFFLLMPRARNKDMMPAHFQASHIW